MRALQTASANPTVMMVLQTARNTPTPTLMATLPATPTPTLPSTGLAQGFQDLARGDLRAASAAFTAASNSNPADDEARFYMTLTLAGVNVLDAQAIRDLAARSNIRITGDTSDICAMHVSFPSTSDVPTTAPSTGEFLDTARSVVRPEIERVLADFTRLSPATQIHLARANLPDCIRKDVDTDTINIDDGDFLLTRGGLETALGLLSLLDGYNLDAPLHTVVAESRQALVQTQPQFLTLISSASLQASQQHLSAAVGLFIQSIDEVRAETHDQTNDAFVIDADDVNDARKVRLLLSLLQSALTGPVSLPIDVVTGEVDLMDTGLVGPEHLNLAKLFSGQFSSLRPFLPAFDASGDFDIHHFPDPMFGGMVPDFTQNKIDNFLIGGPPCAECTSNRDCAVFGRGPFFCGSCFESCQGTPPQRCTDGSTQCSDGSFF